MSLLVRLESCVVLGGSGYRLTAGREATVDFLADSIAFYINSMVGAADARITYPEVIGIQIEGPGAVSRGGGFIGGGFGFEGALEGIAIATVLNALTTKTKVHTFIQILSDVGEVFLHYGSLEPGALRIAMSHNCAVTETRSCTHLRSDSAIGGNKSSQHARALFFDREIRRVTEIAWDQAVNDTASFWQSIFWYALGPERAGQLYGIPAPVKEIGNGSLC